MKKLMLLFVLFVPLVAIAQVFIDPASIDGGVAPLPVPPVPLTTTNFTALLLQALYPVLVMLCGAVATAITKALLSWSSNSDLGKVVYQLWLLVQATVSHVEAEIRPNVESVLATGTLSKEDGMRLKAASMISLKRDAADQLSRLAKSLKLDDAALTTLLSGLIERAVAGLTTPGVASSPSGTLFVAPPRVNS